MLTLYRMLWYHIQVANSGKPKSQKRAKPEQKETTFEKKLKKVVDRLENLW